MIFSGIIRYCVPLYLLASYHGTVIYYIVLFSFICYHTNRLLSAPPGTSLITSSRGILAWIIAFIVNGINTMVYDDLYLTMFYLTHCCACIYGELNSINIIAGFMLLCIAILYYAVMILFAVFICFQYIHNQEITIFILINIIYIAYMGTNMLLAENKNRYILVLIQDLSMRIF